MGCGSSGQVVAPSENGHKANGKDKVASEANGANGGSRHHEDDLPTVVLPETPVKPRP
ncbi:jg2690, partial [Pararge aegeria aegeria]